MYMYMVRYLTSDGRNIKANEYYKYSYGGGESTTIIFVAFDICFAMKNKEG